MVLCVIFFFFSSRRRHTRWNCDWSSDVCSSDLARVHDLVEQDEDDTAEQAAHRQRVEVVLAHRFADEIEGERGEERAPAEGHQGRGDAGAGNPDERDERAERQRGCTDQPEDEGLGRHPRRQEVSEHQHRKGCYITTMSWTSPSRRSTLTPTSCSWRRSSRSTVASPTSKLWILSSSRDAGRRGRVRYTRRSSPSIVRPRQAWKRRNTDAADHAWGAHATGYVIGPSPGSCGKPQNSSGTRWRSKYF